MPAVAKKAKSACGGLRLAPRGGGREACGCHTGTALHLFAARGLAGVRNDGIVDAGGISKGTFYHYFDSRAAMLQALLERWEVQIREEFRSEGADARSLGWDRKVVCFVTIVFGTPFPGLAVWLRYIIGAG